jgi:hypothetical protein
MICTVQLNVRKNIKLKLIKMDKEEYDFIIRQSKKVGIGMLILIIILGFVILYK